ncbi:hypothetical protein VPH35_060610 [Triticum aestivum]
MRDRGGRGDAGQPQASPPARVEALDSGKKEPSLCFFLSSPQAALLDRARDSWSVWRSRGGCGGEMRGRSGQVMVEFNRPSLPVAAFPSPCPIPNLSCTSIFLLYFLAA